MSPEIKSALIRGGIQFGLIAAMGALLYLPSNLEWRLYVSVVLSPAVMALGTRVLGEGWYDSAKANVPGTVQAAARIARQNGDKLVGGCLIAAVLMGLTGCAAGDVAKIAREMARSDRTWCVVADSIYVTVKASGTGLKNGTLSCGREGLTVKSAACGQE
jgi:hypothetical protein